MQVALEDPKRFRLEMTFSRGADLSPLEVNLQLEHDLNNKQKVDMAFCILLRYGLIRLKTHPVILLHQPHELLNH